LRTSVVKSFAPIHRVGLLACFIIVSSTITGCNEEKARSLQTAALQFRIESLAAIDAIDNLRKREIAPPPRSNAEIRQTFVNRFLNSKKEVNATLIDLAIEPYRPPNEPEWEQFVADLKSQYEGFAAIFDKLEGGTLVGVKEVRDSAEHAKTLTVQMALLSNAIATNPPVFIQYRSRVIVRLDQTRQDYQTLQTKIQAKESGSPIPETLPQLITRRTELETETGKLMDEWQQIKQEEQKLLETTVTQCTKAVAVGKEVIEMANRYDDLSLQQINRSIPQLFTTLSSFTGKDYRSIRSKADSLLRDLQTDPFWRTVTQQFLDRANEAANRRNNR
jgi:ElaB/YqjD/DUF883 family membrane-anchored ribosome-binding protein